MTCAARTSAPAGFGAAGTGAAADGGGGALGGFRMLGGGGGGGPGIKQLLELFGAAPPALAPAAAPAGAAFAPLAAAYF